MFLNFLKSYIFEKQSSGLRLSALISFVAGLFLSIQVLMPIQQILDNNQTVVFLENIISNSEEAVTTQITNAPSREIQLFYSIIKDASTVLKQNELLNRLTPETFKNLIEKAFLIQSILLAFIFTAFFLIFYYAAYFGLKMIGPSFYQSSDNNFWSRTLSLPFCLILIIYTASVCLNTLLSPLLLLLISILLSLVIVVYLKNKI